VCLLLYRLPYKHIQELSYFTFIRGIATPSVGTTPAALPQTMTGARPSGVVAAQTPAPAGEAGETANHVSPEPNRTQAEIRISALNVAFRSSERRLTGTVTATHLDGHTSHRICRLPLAAVGGGPTATGARPIHGIM